jgi:cytosolic carboxypeptidase protein 2/3
MGGLPIYMITVTGRGNKKDSIRISKRKVIVIQARIHAGETHSSFIMAKLFKDLASGDPKYDYVLNNYIFKLVPMINVDGAVIGNARASLVGLDLNRRWTDPSPFIHPEIYFLKEVMKSINQVYEKGIQIYCDIHGHNRKFNCFFYGCNKAANQGLLSWTKTRLLPKIYASVTPLFEYKDCRFKVDKCKLNTARVCAWNELKITNSFTLETSMFAK